MFGSNQINCHQTLIKPILIFPQINDLKIKQANWAKYLGVFLDDKLTWNKHIEHIETKLSAASGATYKLQKYVPQLFAGEILPKPLNTNYKSNKIVP